MMIRINASHYYLAIASIVMTSWKFWISNRGWPL